MGFLKDIEDMPNQFEYSKAFFDRWYRPEYTTVIVAGDVKPEEVLPLVEKYWGPWKAGTYKVDVPVEPPPAGPVVAHVPWTAPTLPWVSVAFRLPAFTRGEPRVGGARRALRPRPSGPPRRSTRASWRTSRRSTRWAPSSRRTATPTW